MDVQKIETLPPPPGVFGSLRAGFEVVSGRVALILIPLMLDVFLWLAPRLSINEMLKPFFQLAFAEARNRVGVSDVEIFLRNQTLFMDRLRDFNLLGLLSKIQFFPIGVSGLAMQTLPVNTPLGTRILIEQSSVLGVVGLSFLLIAFGWMCGGLYFRQVSGSVLREDEAGIGLLRAIAQSFLLSVIWVVALIVILFPVSIVVVLVGLLSPVLANIVILVISFLSFWLIVPLFFMPHGIFMKKQNAFYSIYSSLRMIRFSLPTSGVFVVSVFLLSRGLDVLWSVPKDDSWLTLVGFAGHAFITTALLAASFVYYRDMTDWLQNVYERFQQINKAPSSI